MRLPSIRLSLRARLALLYTGLLAGALLLFGGGGFVILRDQLERSFDLSLQANAEHAGGAFALDVTADGRLQPSVRLLEQFASTGGRVVVLDPQGHPLADSAPASPSLPIDAGDLALATRHEHDIRSVIASGKAYRLAVEPIIAGSGLLGYVAWANPTTDLDNLLRTIGLALVLGGLALVGLALLVGWLVARRALGPMVEVTETARAISLSGDFAARVQAPTPHDEVGELALAFNEMLVALEENHQALQRFLGDASHQLRTPLTSMRANLELAKRADLPAEERQALLADAAAEAARMAGLVADLLALARAEAGVRLQFAPVQIDEVLVECVRQQRPAAGDVRVSLNQVEPARVLGDRDRLKELLLILVDNAVRYSPPHGQVSASLEARDGQAVIIIADTGIGLSDDEIPHLFERLYRGRQARAMRPAGTGLGLAIARWITEAHGGTIAIRNRSPVGAEAEVKLPTVD